MIVVPSFAWATSTPVAVSDTVNNIGGQNSAGHWLHRAIGIHNRSSSSALLAIAEGSEVTEYVRYHRLGAGDTLMGGSQWLRVMATGTTGGGHSGAAYEAIQVSDVGLAFTNQPANDGLELVSGNAADTTQSATIYGTTQGTDTVVVETIALNGTTPVSTVKVDWGVILGVELSASCAGTVTVREASGNATITTLTTSVLSKGVEAVAAADQAAYNTPPTVAASGATTKQIGLYGTAPDGTARGDSQALTGATAVAMNLAFGTVTKVLTGDLENTVTVTVSVSSDFLAYY